MKKHISLLLMVFCTVVFDANAILPKKELFVKKRVAKFENVKEGTVIVATYELQNVSNRTITIEYVNPDCICTKYAIDKKEILKGEKAILKLTFDTTGRTGKQKLNAVIKADTETKFYKVICLVYIEG